MDSNKHVNSVVKVALPLLLGGAILYWMYRDFDFGSIREVLTEGAVIPLTEQDGGVGAESAYAVMFAW